MVNDLYARWLDAESQAAYDLQYVPNGHERIHSIALDMGKDLLSPEELKEKEQEKIRRKMMGSADVYEKDKDDDTSAQPASKYMRIQYGNAIFQLTKAAKEMMKEHVINGMTKEMRDGLATISAGGGMFNTSRHQCLAGVA